MKLSRSTRYAFVALVHLAKADPGVPVMAKHIAQEHDIPLEYLLKILHQLTCRGLLKSVRGPQGGFALNLDASAISFLDVVETIEGPLFYPATSSVQAGKNSVETHLENVYQAIGEQAANYLGKSTLMDLAYPKVR